MDFNSGKKKIRNFFEETRNLILSGLWSGESKIRARDYVRKLDWLEDLLYEGRAIRGRLSYEEIEWRYSNFMAARKFNNHPFHLVDPSPWPFFLACSLFCLVVGAVAYFHSIRGGLVGVCFGLISVAAVAACWWRDVIREATFRGYHTQKVTRGIRLGVALFIISEAMFFFSFFWAFLHSSLAPSIEIGGVWPPFGLTVLDPFGVPLLNTAILLTSGATITYTHYCLILMEHHRGIKVFLATIGLAVLFTCLQVSEYIEAPFNISDGIYGSTFFLITGFHGLHVIVGTIFLSVCYVRFIKLHFSPRHHVGFEAAAWYWHFVDVIWLLLYLIVYIWGSLGIID